jgi:hypothetical protein
MARLVQRAGSVMEFSIIIPTYNRADELREISRRVAIPPPQVSVW